MYSLLFHLSEDPWKMKNLAEDETYNSLRTELTNLLKNYIQNLDDF